MSGRIANHGWPWTVGPPVVAALGSALLAAVAYRFSPAVAAVALLTGGAVAVILAYPLLGMCAGVLCAPLEYLNLKLGAVGLSASEAVLLVTAGSVLLRTISGADPLRLSLVHGAFAALIAVSAVGLTFAPDDVVVLKIVLMWSAFLVLSLRVASATPDELRWLLGTLAAAATILAILAVTSGKTIELSQGGAQATNRAQASFSHPAVLAFFLVLSLPGAICLGLSTRGWFRGPMLIAALLILAGLLLTLTRGAIIGAAVSILVLLSIPRFRSMAAILLTGLVIFSAANLDPILKSPQASVVATRLGTITGGEIHTNPRLRIYRGAPQMVFDHPIFGIGAGNFPNVSPLYGLRDRGGEIFDHAHDLPLTIAVETGLLGLGALLVFMGGLLQHAAAILRDRRWLPDFTLAVAPVAALAGILACSITDYPLRTNLVTAVVMMHAGALVGHARMGARSRNTPDEPMTSV